MTESLMELRQMVHSQVKRSENTIQVLGECPIDQERGTWC